MQCIWVAKKHGIAIAAFVGIAGLRKPRALLDVGAGTGGGLERLRDCWPDAHVVGVEPVAALRDVGHKRGIPSNCLIDGDALALPFADDSFDFVMETGVLHHIPDPAKAVAEMVRVAAQGVMISDSNKYGQGATAARRFKGIVRQFGLWNAMIRLQTRGRMSKWSEGDGVFFSYSVFDNLAAVQGKFPRVFVMNTGPYGGPDVRAASSHVMLMAMR